jgi:hypothetical protein
MDHQWMSRETRRRVPRVGIETLCTEIVDGRERHALVADVSAEGLRLLRPFFGGPSPRVVQLEIELPGVDEILWAKGHVCFEQVRRGPGGLLRTSGIRLAAAAARDLRLVRDYVMDALEREGDAEELAFLEQASRYALG